MPTHARARYATHAIRSVLAIGSPELELVVHDTSEDDLLASDVEGISDARLRYVHCREPLSMTENHNRAMAMAEGEFVCLIGDDDTILPDLLEAARWAFSRGVEAIAPEVVANYAWPDFRSRAFGAGHAGRLYMKRRFGGIAKRSARADLDVALGRSALGTDGLPKIYHGLVAREVMERIRRIGGAYFYGTSPDVSGAVGIAAVIDSYIWIDWPLTLAGASAGSNTGRSATKTHVGSLESDPHTRRFRNLVWPEELPRFVSVETVWAHAVFATLSAVMPQTLEHYNFPRLYAACLLGAPAYRGAVRDAQHAFACKARLSPLALRGKVAKEYLRVAMHRAWTLARRLSRPTAAGGRLYQDGIPTIAECAQHLKTLSAEAVKANDLAGLLRSLD
jgi:hypothetical protein